MWKRRGEASNRFSLRFPAELSGLLCSLYVYVDASNGPRDGVLRGRMNHEERSMKRRKLLLWIVLPIFACSALGATGVALGGTVGIGPVAWYFDPSRGLVL